MARARTLWSALRRGVALGVSRVKGGPLSACVQVTNRCNLHCPHCGFWRHPAAPADELTAEDYRRVARELAALGSCVVTIEGGEPLLRPDIAEIVATFSEHHLTSLFTNGTLLTRPLAQRLFEAGLGRAGVSIDFPDAEEHDRRRGRGAWEKAWAAVDLLRDAAPQGGRQIDVATIWMKANQGCLDRLFAQSRERRVGHVLTVLATRGDRRFDGGDEPPEASSVGPALALWRRHRHLRLPSDYLRLAGAFLGGAPMPRCHAGAQSLNLDHVGGVAPCVDRIDEPVGNVRSEPLEVLWRRLAAADLGQGCQECWVVCRGYVQLLGRRGRLRAAWDVLNRL